MMSKQKLFLDFDSTIVNSIQAFCTSYNLLYEDEPNYKPAQWMYVEEWDFKDQCHLLEKGDILDLFGHNLFFKHLEFMDCKTEEVVNKLCNKYRVIVCSLGTPLNIAKKTLWLRDNLPCIKEHILLANEKCAMNKNLVNMQNSIHMDDHVDNLDSTNAEYKIIFGDIYKWNRDGDYPRAWNWADVERMLL